MRLDWGRTKTLAGEALRSAWGLVWGMTLAALAGALVTLAARAPQETAELERRSQELDREMDRVRRANQAMADEVQALETDPVYVETLLRRWKRAGAGERIVE